MVAAAAAAATTHAPAAPSPRRPRAPTAAGRGGPLPDQLRAVECIYLGVGTARAAAVQQEPRDVRLQVALPRGGDPARGQERVPDDHACSDTLVDVVADPAVVIAQAVESEILDEPVES